MPAFLKKLTEHIFAEQGDRLGETCIVLPNRRAILFIKDYLAGLLKKTSFLPEFYSIEDFVAKCSGLTITDPLRDQFSLYSLHRELEGDQSRSIEEFFPYASWMLSDFNEIDMYMLDRDQLFNYLSDTKAMALWNPDGRPMSDFEKRYLDFFRSIKKYYQGLNEYHAEKQMAYQGSAFRQLAENIESMAGSWTWEKVIFAGFNALTPSEEKIIKHLLKSGKAEVFWDADEYYTNDPLQEAGTFLRKYFKILDQKEHSWVENNFAEKKDIHVIGVPQNAGQLKYAGEILQKLLKEKGSLDNTALVLSDESLLLPALNSIPDEAGSFNVTMGLALKYTPLYALLDATLSMHRNAERLSQMRNDDGRSYYSKDLLNLISHPWFHMLINGDKGVLADDLKDLIRKSNRIFFPSGSIKELFNETGTEGVMELFPTEPNPISVLAALKSLLIILRKGFIGLRQDSSREYELELEYLFRFSNLLQRLHDLISTYKTISTLKTLQMIFRQLSGQERIAFRGEPLQGLQVMGMLETRTLDFETVIMLSVNEGVLPVAKMPNSFIPYDMKQEFGLPTYRHNNAIFAYHFYRLLQTPKEVYLLYNTESGLLGGGEKSRFITQLQHEGPGYNPQLKITEELLSMPPPSGNRDTSIIIEKDEHVLRLLSEEARKGFHPSSLNKYINCPLQFYLSRIVKVEEADELEETIDAKTLGTVIHESLRNILEKYKHQVLIKEVFHDLKKETKAEVARQFQRYYHDDDISYGKNYLIVNVAQHMLNQLFDREAAWLNDKKELVITGLEKQFFTTVKRDNEIIGEINFKGTVDRIDTKEGQSRILDYKTGGVTASKLKPKTWDDLFSDPEFSQAFQLMMYSWLFIKKILKIWNLRQGSSLYGRREMAFLLEPVEKKVIDLQILREFENNL